MTRLRQQDACARSVEAEQATYDSRDWHRKWIAERKAVDWRAVHTQGKDIFGESR